MTTQTIQSVREELLRVFIKTDNQYDYGKIVGFEEGVSLAQKEFYDKINLWINKNKGMTLSRYNINELKKSLSEDVKHENN